MNKKLIIIIISVFIAFLLIFFGISAYKKIGGDMTLYELREGTNGESKNNIIPKNSGKINNEGVQNVKLSGSVVFFNKDREIIEIFSPGLKKNIVVSYSDKTIFYFNKNMNNEQYKQAIFDYEKKQKEIMKKIEELKKENSGGGGISLPIMPQQNLYQQVNDIEDLNIEKNDILTVIGDYGGNFNEITALNLIKN